MSDIRSRSEATNSVHVPSIPGHGSLLVWKHEILRFAKYFSLGSAASLELGEFLGSSDAAKIIGVGGGLLALGFHLCSKWFLTPQESKRSCLGRIVNNVLTVGTAAFLFTSLYLTDPLKQKLCLGGDISLEQLRYTAPLRQGYTRYVELSVYWPDHLDRIGYSAQILTNDRGLPELVVSDLEINYPPFFIWENNSNPNSICQQTTISTSRQEGLNTLNFITNNGK